jgi:hypothetical protein
MKQAAAIAVQTGLPVILWGDPGTGKTSFVKALGRAFQYHVEIVVASVREPSDFGGLPAIIEGGVKLVPPLWAVNLKRFPKGILFLDEISTAPPAVQSALLRVTLDKVVGDLVLPKDTIIMAAANPAEQSGGWELSPPLANRFVHLDWSIKAGEWSKGMISGWPEERIPVLPASWRQRVPLTTTSVATFIARRPELLLQVPAQAQTSGRAWPSGRSWEYCAICQAAAQSVMADPDTTATLMSGCIGAGAALEYAGWLEEMDLPDPKELLDRPEKAVLPEEDDRMFATLNAVASTALNPLTEKSWKACWKILGKAAECGRVDLAAVVAGVLVAQRREEFGIPPEIKHFVPLMKALGVVS